MAWTLSRLAVLAMEFALSVATEDIWLVGMLPLPRANSARFMGDTMLDLINQQGTILPGYRLRIIWQDSACSPEVAQKLVLQNNFDGLYSPAPYPTSTPRSDSFDANGSVDETLQPVGVVGCYCSQASARIVELLYKLRVFIISPTNTDAELSDRDRYPNFFRTITPDSVTLSALIAAMHALSFTRLVPVLDGIKEAMNLRLLQEASRLNMSLVGPDLGSFQAGLRGVYMPAKTLEAAKIAVREVQVTGARAVLNMLNPASLHLLLCAQVLEGVAALVHMSFDAEIDEGFDASRGCTMNQVVGAAQGSTVAKPRIWRPDLDARISCLPGQTVGDLQREFYARQLMDEGLSRVSPLGWNLLPEDPAIADTVCMYALMLRALLIDRGHSVAQLKARSPQVYQEGLDILSVLSFQALQGEMVFVPGSDSARTAGTALLQKQTQSGPCTFLGEGCGPYETVMDVAIASFQDGQLEFLQSMTGRVQFHVQEEDFALPCSPGMQFNGTLKDFEDCPNEVYDYVMHRCAPSPLGQAFRRLNVACGSGHRLANDTCVPCEPGTVAAGVSSQSCELCPPGRWASTAGSSECAACGVGKFSSEAGATSCTSCVVGQSTMRQVRKDDTWTWAYVDGSTSPSACGCDKGSREREGSCVPCEEGLDCRGRDDIQVVAGYYSDADISVFRCYRDSARCAGGSPGQTCSVGRVGLLCAECDAEKTPGGDAGGCRECDTADSLAFPIIVLLIMVIVVLVYKVQAEGGELYKWASKKRQNVALVAAVAQLLTALQTVSVLGRIPADWTSPMSGATGAFAVIGFDFEMLQLGCLLKPEAMVEFLGELSLMVLLLAFVLLVHMFSVLVFHGKDFPSRRYALKCTIGSVFMVLYISVVSTLLSPFQCDHHPNGKWTMSLHGDVICWESGAHTAILIIGTCATLLLPLPFLAHCAIAVWRFPAKLQQGDVTFLKEYNFLFHSLDPDKYWYALAPAARNFLTACVLVLPGAVSQIVALQFIMLSSLGSILLVMPWRSYVANVTELLTTSIMVMLCSQVSFFGTVTTDELNGLGGFSFFLLVVIFMPVPFLVLLNMYMMCYPEPRFFQYFLCHHKAGSGAFTRLLKISLQACYTVTKPVFLEMDDHERWTSPFEVVCHHTDTLLIVVSQWVFHQTDCVGEMTLARMRRVNSVLVMLPDSHMPDDRMIRNYEKEAANLSNLTAENIALYDIQETLRWCTTLPRYEGKSFSWASTHRLAAELSSCADHYCLGEDEFDNEARAFIVYNPMDSEASSSAAILHRLLLPHFKQIFRPAPVPLPFGGELPEGNVQLLLLITPGLFQHPLCQRVLAQSRDRSIPMLPIPVQDSFCAMGRSEMEVLERAEGASVAQAVQFALEVETCVPFQPQLQRQFGLEISAQEIAGWTLRTDHKQVV